MDRCGTCGAGRDQVIDRLKSTNWARFCSNCGGIGQLLTCELIQPDKSIPSRAPNQLAIRERLVL